MKKEARVKQKSEFDNIIKTARYKKNSFFVLYYKPKEQLDARFGIAVGTKIGNAVTRNKLKRRVREIIKETIFLFSNPADYIIMVRKQCLALDYRQMKEELIKLIQQVNI